MEYFCKIVSKPGLTEHTKTIRAEINKTRMSKQMSIIFIEYLTILMRF